MLFAQLCGGLGNQMFQYAAARALSSESGLALCLDLSFYNASGADAGSLETISPLFRYNIKYDGVIRDWGELHARCGPLYERYERLAGFYDGIERRRGPDARFRAERLCSPFANAVLGVYLCNDRYLKERPALRSAAFTAGYRQSERYFSAVADEIRAELTLKTPVPRELEPLYERISSCEAACVHVRRGDYLAGGGHLVCTPEYYKRAAELIAERAPNAVFFVFSDDPDWARENITLIGETVYVEGGHPAYEDLRLMSACRSFALSNSSFSWWAQYLSGLEGRAVVAPSRWYADGKRTDIYQDFWQLLGC